MQYFQMISQNAHAFFENYLIFLRFNQERACGEYDCMLKMFTIFIMTNDQIVMMTLQFAFN